MHISWIEELIDFTFGFLGKYAKWLNIKGRRLCFIIWIICGAYWFVVDLQRGLYAQALFCIPTMCFQAYGYYEWKRKRFGEATDNSASYQQSSLPLAAPSQL